MNILTVNIGGSSSKLGFHPANQPHEAVLHTYESDLSNEDVCSRLQGFLEGKTQAIDAICHRIVHAGPFHTEPQLITTDVISAIEEHTDIAPNHNPQALVWIRACEKLFSASIPQFAVFDTGYFNCLPEVASRYAVPSEFAKRRLGFHGLAHQCMQDFVKDKTASHIEDTRVISLQLGSGCSVTASIGGRPIDTSMGYSPLEGLVMATRSGDIDPGLLLHLMKKSQVSPKELERVLYQRSGLLGLSGETGDMDALLNLNSPDAKLAVEIFCYRIKKYVGAYMAAMGGVDWIIFSGGIGENAPSIRAKVLEDMDWFGIALDSDINNSTYGTASEINLPDQIVKIAVVSCEENALMARLTRQMQHKPPHITTQHTLSGGIHG